MSINPILNLQDVSISYRTEHILKNISLQAQRGIFYALTGLNGSGKTSLFKSIIRNIKYQGKIYIEGNDIQSLSTREMAQKVALLSQHNFISIPLTVWEITLMGRYPYRPTFWEYNQEDIERCKYALAITQTDTLKHKKIQDLSGGEAQRVWLAQKIAQNTPLLLLDEPTQHLDIRQKKLFFNLLHDIIQNENKTVIMSTHNLDEIKHIKGTLWHLHERAISVIQDYSPQQIDEVIEKLLQS
ncbi:MAG: ABC transporter ATP-binding protein [Bacteroidia bacterium]|nr:ABC transporter ATP-binding protein [Bacteroidia bacterium]MDW8347282.1 ABC transporter ATP-binding protein [Bacteroidia bacterium]